MQSLSVIVTFTKEIYDKVSSFLTDSKKKKKKSKTNTNKQKQQTSKQTNKQKATAPVVFGGGGWGWGLYLCVYRSQCKTERAATVSIMITFMKKTVGWLGNVLSLIQ